MMTRNEEWLDEKFEKLRSRGAGCSKLFSDELEGKMMKERLNKSSNRRGVWTIAIALLAIGVASGAYASSDALKQWIFGPFHTDSDGTIRDMTGQKIGENQVLEDGTKIATMQADDVQIVVDGHVPEGTFQFSFEPLDGSDAKTPNSEGRAIDK